jgi:urease accessory protein
MTLASIDSGLSRGVRSGGVVHAAVEGKCQPRRSRLGAVEGAACVLIEQVGQHPQVSRLYQRQPLRVLTPRAAEGDPLTLVLVNSSGGVVGGDRLYCNITVEAGAACLVTAQSAEKLYRSAGAHARVEVALAASDGAWLEFLPQGTIVFDGARAKRMMSLEVRSRARILAGEILLLGRIASGEKVLQCSLRDRWEVRRNGTLQWADILRLEGDIRAVAGNPAALGGATALATCVYVAPDAARHVDLARTLQQTEAGPRQVRCGATLVNGVLVLRWLGENAQAVRESFGRFWCLWRAAIAYLPARLPRIWAV